MSHGGSAPAGVMRRVIVNADDLGRSQGINEGVFRAHREGVVTSATLMVTMPHAEAAARALPLHPELGVGLHVTLTGGVPWLDPTLIPSLVNSEGLLPAKPELLKALVASEVEREIVAQWDRFRELTGAEPTHLDSHHHSHRHPAILEVMIRLAADAGVPVRCSGEPMRLALIAAGARTTDAFDESFFGERATAQQLLQVLDSLVPGTTEIMCHPGVVDDALRSGSSYLDDRERELDILCRPETFAAFRERDLERITFADL